MIVTVPGKCSGKPHVKGTRITVASIKGAVATRYGTRMQHAQFVKLLYPELSITEILEALDYREER